LSRSCKGTSLCKFSKIETLQATCKATLHSESISNLIFALGWKKHSGLVYKMSQKLWQPWVGDFLYSGPEVDGIIRLLQCYEGDCIQKCQSCMTM